LSLEQDLPLVSANHDTALDVDNENIWFKDDRRWGVVYNKVLHVSTGKQSKAEYYCQMRSVVMTAAMDKNNEGESNVS